MRRFWSQLRENIRKNNETSARVRLERFLRRHNGRIVFYKDPPAAYLELYGQRVYFRGTLTTDKIVTNPQTREQLTRDRVSIEIREP